MIEQISRTDAHERHGPYTVLRGLPASYFATRFLVRRDGASATSHLAVVQERDEATLARLSNAASGCASVRHRLLPGDARVERVGSELLCAARFHDGATVQELFAALAQRGEAMPLEVLLCVASDVLDALAAIEIAAHAKGGRLPRVHGGVHPQTIHVGIDGATRLLDVGLAAAATAEARWASSPGRILYCAPEVVRASNVADVRSDIFSLGALLWEMVACRPLFQGDTARSAREQVLHGPIPRVFRDRFVRGEPISAALTDVIERALQRVPAARFGSFAEVTSALRGCGVMAAPEEVGAFVERIMGQPLGRQDGRTVASASRSRADTADMPTSPSVTAALRASGKRASVDSLTPTVRPPEPATAAQTSLPTPLETTRETPLEATLAAATEAALAIAPALAPAASKGSTPRAASQPPAAVPRPPASPPVVVPPAPPPAVGPRPPPPIASPAPMGRAESSKASAKRAEPEVAASPKWAGIPVEALDTEPPQAERELAVEVDSPTAADDSAPVEAHAARSSDITESAGTPVSESEPVPPAGDLPRREAIPTHPTGRIVVVAVVAALALLLAWLVGGRDGGTQPERDEHAPAAASVAKPAVKPASERAPEPAPSEAASAVPPGAAHEVEAAPPASDVGLPAQPAPRAASGAPAAPKPVRRRRAPSKQEPADEDLFIPDGI